MPFLVSLEREMINVFEDHKRTVVKLKSFFLKTLYLWTTALDFYMPSFHNFLNLFSFSNLVFFLYTSFMRTWIVPFCAFNDISFNSKKKKKIDPHHYHLLSYHDPLVLLLPQRRKLQRLADFSTFCTMRERERERERENR
jgi:hypothetical protein